MVTENTLICNEKTGLRVTASSASKMAENFKLSYWPFGTRRYKHESASSAALSKTTFVYEA